MEIKICKVDAANPQSVVIIRDSIIEVRSNGRCRSTSVKINGRKVDPKRLVLDFDFNKPFADIILEVYGGVDGQ